MKQWPNKKIGEVCTLSQGLAINVKTKHYLVEKSNLPLLRIKDLKNGTVEQYVDPDNFPESCLVNETDIIYTRTGQVGLVFTGKSGIIHNNCFKILPDESLSREYLIYVLRSDKFKKNIIGLSSRTAQPDITHKIFKEQTISIPQISEQKQIVAILDEVFAGIDDAIANTEKNLTNARELFESYLNDVFTHKGQKWVEKNLSEIVQPDCSLSYGIVQPGQEYENGLPIVRPTDLKTKIITLDNLKRIDPLLADSYKRTRIQGGELLLCVRGSTGVLGTAADELIGGNVTRGIVPIRFETSMVLQSFGYYALISKPVQDQISAKTYGAALMQINIRDVRKISIAFPIKIEKQQLLLENLGLVEKETKRLEAIYQQKLTALNELKQSILQKAFTGELTADTASQSEKDKDAISV